MRGSSILECTNSSIMLLCIGVCNYSKDYHLSRGRRMQPDFAHLFGDSSPAQNHFGFIYLLVYNNITYPLEMCQKTLHYGDQSETRVTGNIRNCICSSNLHTGKSEH